MSQRKNSPLSSIWLKLLLAVISACSTLLILEIMVRFLPPPYSLETGQMFTCDPNLGWIGTPNFDGMFEGPNFKQHLNKVDFPHPLGPKSPHNFPRVT